MKKRILKSTSFIFCLLYIFFYAPLSFAQTNEDCFDCHDDTKMTTERQGKTISLFVDGKILETSVHDSHLCIDCHTDANANHPEHLKPVNCAACHEAADKVYKKGVHGQAMEKGDPFAPNCAECHGKHEILSSANPKATTFKTHIPFLCGKCHREGAPVSRNHNISQHNILDNYTQSMHGEGMFKKGLLVSATCNDCHGSHLVLPHTDPNSPISLSRIAQTCMKCHSRIEEMHTQVIKGELWEKKPGIIPACSDCHPPHLVNKQNIVAHISDRACLRCHAQKDLFKVENDKRHFLYIDKRDLDYSVHKDLPCIKCHSDASPELERPCSTSSKVDCSNCHAEVAKIYYKSGHGEAHLKKDPNAPDCKICHGTHQVKSKFDESSKTYRAEIPKLCGNCHQKEGKASKTKGLTQVNVLFNYSHSVHGKGLVEKGLLPSAVCTDCHTPHQNQKGTEPASAIYSKNIPTTCGKCHRGILNEYKASIHDIDKGEKNKLLPTCVDCHSAHEISETEQDQFMKEATHQCGSCHKKLSETYLQTVHGKTYELGSKKAAKCSNCHGAHKILPINDPDSAVGTKKIVETCRQCHADANEKFTGYLTHATHHDPVKYPALFYTFWAMTTLLVSVFVLFGVHTLLWLPKSLEALRKRKKREAGQQLGKYYIKRFTKSQRLTHLFVILSFIALALTGMMLKFSGMPWAKFVANLLGGVEGAAFIHRFAALVTFGYFAFHLSSLFEFKKKRLLSWRQLVFGPNSLMFNKQDWIDFIATLRWFVGKGPQPKYGRWTYWEKFDYFAVFWGVAVIGASGLMLWFPEFFTKFVPGWLINVAQIIHSDEALLAVGFIFTIHFFNTHMRPESFPMDTVIFTGLVPLEEFKEIRPKEYEAMKASGELRKKLVKKELAPRWEKLVKIFGGVALTLGIVLIFLIIYSSLFGYH